MQFKAIIGHTEIKGRLLQSVKDNRVSHAQLFIGPEGAGALALAIAYGQYLNCLSPLVDDSCGICDNCRKYEKLIHPDLHFTYPFVATDKEDHCNAYLPQWRELVLKNSYFNLDDWRNQLEIEKKAVNINTAECQNILRKSSLKAFEAKFKVQIIWLPEYLGKESNRLLKIIEEPPANTVFILIAENQEKLLTTIRSRTQIVKIPKFTLERVKSYLQEEGGLSEQKAQQVAFLTEGNMAKALHLLQFDENEFSLEFTDWLRNILKLHKFIEIMDFIEIFAKRSRDQQKNFFHYGINFMREIWLIRQGLQEIVRLNEQELQIAEKIADKVVNEFMIQEMIQKFEEAIFHIERNANAKILFLDVSLQLHLILSKLVLPQKAVDLLT